jgi:hypothetical protein
VSVSSLDIGVSAVNADKGRRGRQAG